MGARVARDELGLANATQAVQRLSHNTVGGVEQPMQQLQLVVAPDEPDARWCWEVVQSRWCLDMLRRCRGRALHHRHW